MNTSKMTNLMFTGVFISVVNNHSDKLNADEQKKSFVH